MSIRRIIMTLPPTTKTPLTDAARFYDSDYECYLVSEDFACQLELQNQELKAELEFLKSKGLIVGMMKTSDKP